MAPAGRRQTGAGRLFPASLRSPTRWEREGRGGQRSAAPRRAPALPCPAPGGRQPAPRTAAAAGGPGGAALPQLGVGGGPLRRGESAGRTASSAQRQPLSLPRRRGSGFSPPRPRPQGCCARKGVRCAGSGRRVRPPREPPPEHGSVGRGHRGPSRATGASDPLSSAPVHLSVGRSGRAACVPGRRAEVASGLVAQRGKGEPAGFSWKSTANFTASAALEEPGTS